MPSESPIAQPRRVGVPVAEAELTSSVFEQARSLVGLRPGQRLIVILEADMPIGRPDLLLLTCWSSALDRHAKSGRRLHKYSEAKVLAAIFTRGRLASHDDVGMTREHFARTRRQLLASGWATARPPGVVASSLLIEAKTDHWAGGISQLMRERSLAADVALVVPERRAKAVSRPLLKRQRIGLLQVKDGQVQWLRRGSERQPSLAARLWLTELASQSLRA
jgi:hypothetical protein